VARQQHQTFTESWPMQSRLCWVTACVLPRKYDPFDGCSGTPTIVPGQPARAVSLWDHVARRESSGTQIPDIGPKCDQRPQKRQGPIYYPDICDLFRLPFLAQRCIASRLPVTAPAPRFVVSLRSPGAVRFGRPFRPVGRSVTGRQVESTSSPIFQQRSFENVCKGIPRLERFEMRDHTPLFW